MPLAAADLPPPGPDDLAFSVENMDVAVDPGANFQRYASGSWLDRVQRPERLASYGVFDIVGERLKAQMKLVLAQAGAHVATAPEGSPARQVGAFYNAYMDTAARDAAGMTPLRPQLDAIAAVAVARRPDAADGQPGEHGRAPPARRLRADGGSGRQ